MSAAVTLTYFGLPGRAFAIRVALNAALERKAIASFEDKRLTFQEWKDSKDSLNAPLGQLPIVEIDGKVFCQSVALTRWSAKLAGLMPEDPLQVLVTDEVIATADEMWNKVPHGGENLETRRKEWVELARSKHLAAIERRIAEHDGPFLLGKEMTVGDLFLWSALWGHVTKFFDHTTGLLDTFPRITALYNAVDAHPLCAKYTK